MKILKKIGGTLMLPVGMYIVMMILCYANGKMFFGTWAMWKTLSVDIAVSITCALGIGLQFKCGRFDFSGGAIMLIAGILAGNIARDSGNNVLLMVVLALAICVVLSLLVSFLYVYGRLPIIIATIGMAMLYESITCLLYNGTGVNLVPNMTLRVFATFPMVLIPLVIAIAIYAFYSYFTTTGKQAVLLSNNQQSAVNIGINENKNVIISYIFSGLLFGLATIIWLTKSIHNASFSSLTTVGELFSNILPVFIGLMLVNFCGDTIGIIMGSITLCLLNYGLKAVFSNETGAAIATIVTGIFILMLNVVSAQGMNWIHMIKKAFKRKETI
ncbi:MAG: hypothetical protein IJ106_12965 [Parasporobacterium sp.]|nr:hypothetical protein [Parasporobacterium sp.]